MDQLPKVKGRRMTKSLAALERQCLVLLKAEQEKILPDNHIIDTLCECVRMKREYCDGVQPDFKREEDEG